MHDTTTTNPRPGWWALLATLALIVACSANHDYDYRGAQVVRLPPREGPLMSGDLAPAGKMQVEAGWRWMPATSVGPQSGAVHEPHAAHLRVLRGLPRGDWSLDVAAGLHFRDEPIAAPGSRQGKLLPDWMPVLVSGGTRWLVGGSRDLGVFMGIGLEAGVAPWQRVADISDVVSGNDLFGKPYTTPRQDHSEQTDWTVLLATALQVGALTRIDPVLSMAWGVQGWVGRGFAADISGHDVCNNCLGVSMSDLPYSKVEVAGTAFVASTVQLGDVWLVVQVDGTVTSLERMTLAGSAGLRL